MDWQSLTYPHRQKHQPDLDLYKDDIRNITSQHASTLQKHISAQLHGYQSSQRFPFIPEADVNRVLAFVKGCRLCLSVAMAVLRWDS